MLIWLIIGRYILRVLVGGRQNFVTELFRVATDPVLGAVRRIAPGFVGNAFVPLLTIALLLALRVTLLPALV